eukprot:TRINITY_DN10672_c0_g1_i1.p1 TRINITY_DN10672_c0_g1~~TRINITY_DN10672_c0_g1_i1.p1  ORF type:complete len:448 (+),score=130.64 TRINITY_DN10672_c0_g1_i1:33-1346(+)
MDGTYDAIVLGTGLKECIISGLLSVDGLKVLHLDRNGYYGAESASLNLTQLFEKFRNTAADQKYGESRLWAVDLIPKLILSSGTLVKILLHTDVHKYMEFKSVQGSYVLKSKKIHKVPATEKEAWKSNLMSLMEKNRFKNFLEFCQKWDPATPKTLKGFTPESTPMKDVYKKYSVDSNTIDFIGHAIALHTNDEYLEKPCGVTIDKVKLYFDSLSRYANSPYIYPVYGLGELPQAFARLSAIYGGTYMLEKPVDELVMEGGKCVGVKSEGEVAKAKFVVCDPSYASNKVKKVGQVVRTICILDHPVANTHDAASVQVIVPQKQVNRKNDIYVCCCASEQEVCPKGYYIAEVSTTVETDNPEAELEPGIKLLGDILEKFTQVSDIFEPTDDGADSKVFITKSYDAQSHFEATCNDILDVYKRITGKELVLTVKEQQEE